MVLADVGIGAADPASFSELVDITIEAFATEGITGYVFDLGKARTIDALHDVQLIELELALAGGDHVLVARRRDHVDGGAILSRNAPPALHVRVVFALRWLFAIAPLLTSVRWRHVPAMKRATRPPRPLERTYFTLAALAVQPQYQGFGIGKALLEEVNRISDEDEAAQGVYLYTGDPRSRRLYEDAGYRTVVTRRLSPYSVYHMFRRQGGGESFADGRG